MDFGQYRYLGRRLKSMRPAEPFYRALLQARHWNEKRRIKLDPQAMSWSRMWAERNKWLKDGYATDSVEDITKRLVAVLPSGWWQDRSFWDVFSSQYPLERDHLVGMAEEAVAGRVGLFQWKVVSLSTPIQWSQTMEPGRPDAVWPDSFFDDINIWHNPRREERDIRWCWELNRFQHLLWLGSAWRLTGREEFAAVARDHVTSWLDSVRYPFGVHWQSNLEVGLRALSWARCHVLCHTSKVWDKQFMERFLASLYVHARHLYREMGLHLPLGNHLLGEAAALYCLGTLYPVLSEAEEWRRRSIAIFNRIVPRLILRDGSYVEQATGYLRFVMEFLLAAIHLSDGPVRDLAPLALERVTRAAEWVQDFSGAFGKVPMLGDSDSGLATGWRLSDFWDFRAIQASAAVLLERPALAEGLTKLPAESFLLVGKRGLSMVPRGTAKAKQAASDRAPASIADFPSGGYWVSRDERFAVGFDTGPLGLAPGFCHGHSDSLSLVVNVDGKPLAVDPGTGLYNGPQKWRDYFRSTAAHNTISIDGADPTAPLGTFRWSGPTRISANTRQSGSGWTALSGTVRWGALDHRRVVVHVHGQSILVLDHVTGSGEHDLEWRLHLDPNWRVELLSDRLVSASWEERAVEIMVTGGRGERLLNLRGSEEPLGGWYSAYYGSIVPTATLAAKATRTLPVALLTVIKPSDACFTLPHDIALSEFAGAFKDLLASEELSRFVRCIHHP